MLSRKKRANIFFFSEIVCLILLALMAKVGHNLGFWCMLASFLVLAGGIIFMLITAPKPRPIEEQVRMIAARFNLDPESALDLAKQLPKGNFIAVPKIQTLTAYEQECREQCQKTMGSFKELIDKQTGDILIFPEGEPNCQPVITKLRLKIFHYKES